MQQKVLQNPFSDFVFIDLERSFPDFYRFFPQKWAQNEAVVTKCMQEYFEVSLKEVIYEIQILLTSHTQTQCEKGARDVNFIWAQ